MSADLGAIAAELGRQAADRLVGRLAEAPDGGPRAALAWSSFRVLENPPRYLQVVVYLGRHVPRAPDEPPPAGAPVVNDFPHYPDQGELLL